MMPSRLTRPTVGLIPTSAATADGQMMLPSVSVPMPTAARLAAIALPVPALEPQGLRSSASGLRVWPQRALQPKVERDERLSAHSLRAGEVTAGEEIVRQCRIRGGPAH